MRQAELSAKRGKAPLSCIAAKPEDTMAARSVVVENDLRANFHEILPRKSAPVNPSLRLAIIILALVIGLAPRVEAGPFRDFFKKVRRTFTQSKHASRSHNNIRRQANHTASKDLSAAPTAETRGRPGPPDERNTRAATAPRSKKPTSGGLRYGTPVPGKKGFVTSPFAPDSGYVDVRDFPPGTQVKDPYTGKIFLTP